MLFRCCESRKNSEFRIKDTGFSIQEVFNQESSYGSNPALLFYILSPEFYLLTPESCILPPHPPIDKGINPSTP